MSDEVAKSRMQPDRLLSDSAVGEHVDVEHVAPSKQHGLSRD